MYSQYPPMSPRVNNNIPYLIAIVIMTLFGMAGVLLVMYLRPNADNASLFVAIAGFVGPTTGALLAFLKTQETHLLVNSRMDEFKRLLEVNAEASEKIARQEGVSQGLKEARAGAAANVHG